MTFVGLVAMMDPPRPDVSAAIQKCFRANIRVIVITGDNKETAVAICRLIGVFGEHEDVSHSAFLGSEFAAMSREAQLKAIEKAALFSRVEPKHKKELVELLKSQGHVSVVCRRHHLLFYLSACNFGGADSCALRWWCAANRRDVT
jgi:Ca2+ transporting ATPase